MRERERGREREREREREAHAHTLIHSAHLDTDMNFEEIFRFSAVGGFDVNFRFVELQRDSVGF